MGWKGHVILWVLHNIFNEAFPNGVHILMFLFLYWLWSWWTGPRCLLSEVSLLSTVVYCSLYWRSPGTGRLITGELLSQVSSAGSERWELLFLCWLQLRVIFTSRGQRVLGSRLTQPLTQLAEQTSLLWPVVGQVKVITVTRDILICHDVLLTPHTAGQAPLPPPHCPPSLRSGAPVLRRHLHIEDESLTAGLV